MLRVLHRLVPRISDALPLEITAKQIKSVVARILANRQTSHRPHQLSSDNLFARTCKPMAMIYRRVANHRCSSDDLWARLHVVVWRTNSAERRGQVWSEAPASRNYLRRFVRWFISEESPWQLRGRSAFSALGQNGATYRRAPPVLHSKVHSDIHPKFGSE
jgi:hypothetical protein